MEFVRHGRRFYIPYPTMVDIHREAFGDWTHPEQKREPMPEVEFIYSTVIDKLRSTGYHDLAAIIEADSLESSTRMVLPTCPYKKRDILYNSIFTYGFWTSSRDVVIDISALEDCKRMRMESARTNQTMLKAYRGIFQHLVDLNILSPYSTPSRFRITYPNGAIMDIIDTDVIVHRAIMYDLDIDDHTLDRYRPGVLEALIEGFVPIIVKKQLYDDRLHEWKKIREVWPNLLVIRASELRKIYEKDPDGVIAKLDTTVITIPHTTSSANIEFITQFFSKHRDFMPRLIEGYQPTTYRTQWRIDLREFMAARAIECAGQPTLLKAYLERRSAKATIWKFWKRARFDPKYLLCRTRLLHDMEDIEASIHNKRQRCE
jgi:hypothetical protein